MESHPATFRPPRPPDPTTNRSPSLPSITYTQPPAINWPESDENRGQKPDLPQAISAGKHCSGDTHAGAPLSVDSPLPDDHNHGRRSPYGASNRSELHLKVLPALPVDFQFFGASGGTHGRGSLPVGSPSPDDHNHGRHSPFGAPNRPELHLEGLPALPAQSLPPFHFSGATSGTHSGRPPHTDSSHHGQHPYHMGLHQFHPNLANRTDPIPQGQKSDSLLIDPTNVFDSAIKRGVNEIQAPNTLGNVPIAEITSLICRILESNGVLHTSSAAGQISSMSEHYLRKLTPPMNSAGPKTSEGPINSIENITLDFVPKCTQIEAVGTAVSGQNSIFLTLPSSPEHMKTFGETIAPAETDGKSALGNVPSGTHTEANPSNVFGPPLIPGTAPLAPNHGKTPRINTLPPSTSQTARTINVRVPPARTTPTTTEQKKQQASTSGAHVSQADQPIVAQSIASIVDTASVNPPRVQSVAPDNIAPSSAITPTLAPSQPVIHVDSDYTDPLAHDMSRRTHDSEATDRVVRQLPGPTPGRTGNPASSSPLSPKMETHPAAFRPPWPPNPTTNRTTSLPSITYTQPQAINSLESDENRAQKPNLPSLPDDHNHGRRSPFGAPNRPELLQKVPPAQPAEFQFSGASGGTHGRGPPPVGSPPPDDHNHGPHSPFGAPNRPKLRLEVPPALPAESLPPVQFFGATSWTHSGGPPNFESSHHGQHSYHMGLHQFYPNLANRTDSIPQGQKSDSLLIDPTYVFDSAIKRGVKEIQAPNTLGNVPIAEITSLICRILESNGVLHTSSAAGQISSISEHYLRKLTPPMNSAGPKTSEGTIISIENITLDFVPKCTQTEAVGTIVSGQNSAFLTLPSSSEHMKTFGETIAPIKNDGKSALGNVLSGTHIEANPSNVFGPPLIPGTVPLAPNHGKTPRINTFPPSTSQTARTINARVPPARKQPPPPRATPRPTATSTTAHSGPKSYAAVVSNVPVVSQAERSQKKSFAQILRASQESTDHKLISRDPFIHHESRRDSRLAHQVHMFPKRIHLL
ncbi:Hypothetical predicted protein [Olea europaea subsp. europaea]|uniref:Uncharacterized protein n=1 Tax=Olea europaea subsp. europaea TaxID=158383 RepID=A0A8S0PZ59_OLEEU|nr:Hypothetical predicted protein [Olea europaea subsp. europaea]